MADEELKYLAADALYEAEEFLLFVVKEHGTAVYYSDAYDDHVRHVSSLLVLHGLAPETVDDTD